MFDVPLLFIPTFLSGYVFSSSFKPFLFRTLIFFFLIFYFSIPLIFNLNSFFKYFFIIFLTLFILLFKLILYLVEFLINSSFEISSSSEENKNSLPNGISQNLWLRRNEYNNIRLLNDDAIVNLINNGFDPDEVFLFYSILSSNLNEQSSNRTQNINNNQNQQNYLKFFGSVIPISLSKQSINNYFPTTFKFYIIIFSTILTFLLNFLFLFILAYL